MRRYTPNELARIMDCEHPVVANSSAEILWLSYDTRQLVDPSVTLFFALNGAFDHGHIYINHAIASGVVNIVCDNNWSDFQSNVNYYRVPNVLEALQHLATFHRAQFDIEVIGITGSNGKTTVKEWLSQLIDDRRVVKSPKSYNSQLGVPISVWQMSDQDDLAIFEAGISQPKEMERLAEIINPTIGLMLNIGDAHDAGFDSRSQKIKEKLKLFTRSKSIIYCSDHAEVAAEIDTQLPNVEKISWGRVVGSLFKITDQRYSSDRMEISIHYKNEEHLLLIPFTNDASIENCLHCIAVCLTFGYDIKSLSHRLLRLHNLPMRLEMKSGDDDAIIVNDTYSADIHSLRVALQFLSQQSGDRTRTLILSDFEQLDLSSDQFVDALAAMVNKYNISKVVGIGNDIAQLSNKLTSDIAFYHYHNVDSLIEDLHRLGFERNAILIKGARRFGLERVVHLLSQKRHTTVLETDMQAIDHNIRYFSSLLGAKTKMVAVIKAAAYGSGSAALAKFLAFRQVDALAVAYADEGVYLRQNNVDKPIIILNPDSASIVDLFQYNLEPEIHGMALLDSLISYISIHSTSTIQVHIKIDTGMRRLGFLAEEVDVMINKICANPAIHIKSIFSHLSGSEDKSLDYFTHEQVNILNQTYLKISAAIGYHPLKHILNSSGILRFPEYHFDWVRLGLGLYGIDSTGQFGHYLEKAHTFKSTVIQIKPVSSGDTVGYNRNGIVSKSGFIAILNVGYADGLRRLAGNGLYSIEINGKSYPTIGNICMDLTMVELGQMHNVKVGDEAIIFGKTKSLNDLAIVCQTIPYEIITSISQRVKRIYTHA